MDVAAVPSFAMPVEFVGKRVIVLNGMKIACTTEQGNLLLVARQRRQHRRHAEWSKLSNTCENVIIARTTAGGMFKGPTNVRNVDSIYLNIFLSVGSVISRRVIGVGGTGSKLTWCLWIHMAIERRGKGKRDE